MAAAYRTLGGEATLPDNRSGYLRLGSQGAGVRDLQAMLNLAGYKVAIDGDFGDATEKAVMAFQKTHKLLADGIVGPKTQTALTAVRDVAPVNAGQQKLIDIDQVKKGGAIAVAVPTAVNTLKDELTSLVEQVSPYAYLSKITDILQTGIAILTVGGIVVGVGYAAYGWFKSRKSYTGTKSDTALLFNSQGEEDQLILPAL
nr:peptidoglycan-binding domain-containing protein [Xanthomonas campestris]